MERRIAFFKLVWHEAIAAIRMGIETNIVAFSSQIIQQTCDIKHGRENDNSTTRIYDVKNALAYNTRALSTQFDPKSIINHSFSRGVTTLLALYISPKPTYNTHLPGNL